MRTKLLAVAVSRWSTAYGLKTHTTIVRSMGAAEAFISGIRELKDFTAFQSAVEPIVIDVDEYSPNYRVLIERTQVDTLWVNVGAADDEDDALEKAYDLARDGRYEREMWDSDSTEYETKEVVEADDE